MADEDGLTSPAARRLQSRLFGRGLLAFLAAIMVAAGLEVLWPGWRLSLVVIVAAQIFIPAMALRAYRRRFPLPRPAS